MNALAERHAAGTLTLSQQLKWAKDITTAFIHISASPASFYSDLRPDNIVISVGVGGTETATLIDFEQGRNLYNWAAPEIYYIEWIAELGDEGYARSDAIEPSIRAHYKALLTRYLASRSFPYPPLPNSRTDKRGYDNPEHGWYFPWLASSQAEREAAEVYMLGRVMWCIFEGRADADIVLGRSTKYEVEQDRDGGHWFPEFRQTPEALRPLISRCTAGAREWEGEDGPLGICRVGGKVFPRGRTGRNGEPAATFEETMDAITKSWRKEMEKAEAFIEAKMRYDSKSATEEDLKLLGYLKRPKLDDVLLELDGFRLPGAPSRSCCCL